MKKNKTLLIIFYLFLSVVFSQKADLITQKINVENAIRSKVEHTVNKFLDESQYIILVNATLDLKPLSMESVNTKKGEKTTTPGYSYIPGIPTKQNIYQPEPGSGSFQFSTDVHYLYGMTITIYIDETITTGGLQQNIKTLVLKNIPEIADCDDCVLFESVDLSSKTTGGSRFDELNERINNLEEEKRAAEARLIEWKQDKLQEQLDKSETARVDWENQARRREDQRREEDALRLASLQKIEQEYRDKQDSLYILTSIKLDEALRGRIVSEENTKKELLGLIKMQIQGEDIGNDHVSDDTRSDLYTKRPTMVSNAFSGQMWLIIAVVVILLIILFTLLSKNKGPIYLKPKETKGNNQPSEATQSAGSFPQTNANENEEVQRSELHSLRQSAVSMSVSEKAGANEIVQDWLNDGTGEKNENEKAEDNETNEAKE